MIEVDARGYSCPEPVMMALNAIKSSKGEPVRVLASTTVARDNIKTMATKQKKEVSVESIGNDFALTIQ